ncbi:DUF2865 domain-containing protein [Rhodopseudomonas palustris]|uniref:DUF2865 domain-containing protein n=1 Tax=Rhodopseudomonas palustris TaxID=1076 RepID=UPI00115D0349|nr:DUF2865 domain-containing protein [Rhodopseudomonas palustris]QDL98782.1 DUF2865 domain-containing protein [Rhodopseudomonas palustris]
MSKLTPGRIFACTAAVAAVVIASPAPAQDFFQSLFGGFHAPRGAYHPRMPALPFAEDGYVRERERVSRPSQRSYSSGSGQAFCVRTCDGRYFPISATGGAAKSETCSSFCPASATQVVYGSAIENARTSGGKPYSDLPNAFKYRTEIVAGCTCNGKDQFGLAQIAIQDDPTVRRGDIIAGKDGLMVAARNASGGDGKVALAPASGADHVRAGYSRVPVLAQD